MIPPERYKFIPDFHSFLRKLNEPLPTFIRINTLRGGEKDIVTTLQNKGFELEKTPIMFFYKVKKLSFHLQATPEYILGKFYIQNPSSALPVFALSPKPKETILDMASAPGGKASLIAQLTKNRAELYCVEKDTNRALKMRFIFDRLGVRAVVINRNALELPFQEDFKKILLDAPCSANPYVDRTFFAEKTIESFKERQSLQIKLIEKAYQYLKKGGYLVYSTCTLEPLENEFVIDYAVRELGFEIVKKELFGEPALREFEGYEFVEGMEYCRRVYPHLHEGFEPFFYCLLRKK